MNLTVDYHARYSDGKSYRVLYDAAEKKTYLATEDAGRMAVPYYINGAEFVEFYFTGPRGISTQYAWTLRNQMDQILTPPVKPTEPPKGETKEDPKLHVEPGTNWSGHKRAFAEQEIAVQRQQRQAARTEIQNVAPDPTKVAAARAANEYAAAIKRPRGPGTSQATDIPSTADITRGEIEAVTRNRRI